MIEYAANAVPLCTFVAGIGTGLYRVELDLIIRPSCN